MHKDHVVRTVSSSSSEELLPAAASAAAATVTAAPAVVAAAASSADISMLCLSISAFLADGAAASIASSSDELLPSLVPVRGAAAVAGGAGHAAAALAANASSASMVPTPLNGASATGTATDRLRCAASSSATTSDWLRRRAMSRAVSPYCQVGQRCAAHGG